MLISIFSITFVHNEDDSNDGMDEKKPLQNGETSKKQNLNHISCRGMYLQQLAGKV